MYPDGTWLSLLPNTCVQPNLSPRAASNLARGFDAAARLQARTVHLHATYAAPRGWLSR